MDKIKTVALVGGVVLIWVGGFVLVWKGGEIIGNQVGKLCIKGTEKLVKILS